MSFRDEVFKISSVREAIGLFTVFFIFAFLFLILIYGFIPEQVTTHDYYLDFDGKDDYVYFENSDSLEITDSVTISAWVKPDELKDNHQTIVAKGNTQYGLELCDNGHLRFFVHGDYRHIAKSENLVQIDEWTHLVGKYTSATEEISLWINGSKQRHKVTSGKIPSHDYRVTIGYNPETGDRYFDGRIENVRIYNRPLSESEINKLYNHSLGDNTSLVGWWKFNEADSQTVRDSSPWTNNGVLGSSKITDSNDPVYLQTVTVTPQNSQQKFDGFGTSLAWWADSVGGWKSSKREEMVDLVFGSENLNFNIARYNIGGGENPSHDHMVESREMEGYKPKENGGYKWSRDNNQRMILQGAVERGAEKLIAFSNSPPYWMTKSGCASGSMLGYTNNLKTDYYDNFANYLATVVEHFHENWGITFDALAPLNEPSTSWRKYGTQEGCHFTLNKQNLLIKEVGRELESRGLYMGISAPQEFWMGSSLDSIYPPPEISSSESSFKYYDETAKSYISIVATHAYSASDTDRKALRDLAQSYGKKIYQSEYDVGFSRSDKKNYLILANEISKDINTLGAHGWIQWQAAETFEKKEGGPDWGLVLINENQIYITKKYYAMSNYSRFIEPGSRILNSNKSNVVMAHDSVDNELVIVTVNDENYDYNYEYDVSKFLESGEVIPYRTSMEEDLVRQSNLRVSDGAFVATAEKKSITTYVIPLATK